MYPGRGTKQRGARGVVVGTLAYHVKWGVPSTLTLRVEVKEPTEDEKHSGSDHPRRFNHISSGGFRGGGRTRRTPPLKFAKKKLEKKVKKKKKKVLLKYVL